MIKTLTRAVCATLLATILLSVTTPVFASNWTALVSKSELGEATDGRAIEPNVSNDGRYVAFSSYATNVVENDTNGHHDIFVRDTLTGTTERISLSSDGVEGIGPSLDPAISGDGRFVAFESRASNLVEGDTNETIDVFVHDRLNGTTRRISVSNEGIEGESDSRDASISQDGRFIAFISLARNFYEPDSYYGWQIYVHDQNTSMIEMVSVNDAGIPGNWSAVSSDISGNGRFVALESYANNLSPGDTSTGLDIFVRDLVAQTTERVSVDSEGSFPPIPIPGNSFNPTISHDGRFVAFESTGTYLVDEDTNDKIDIILRDRLEGATTLVSLGENGVQGNEDSLKPSISGDGRYIVFEGRADNFVQNDINLEVDIFMRDRILGLTSRVSVGALGEEANDSNYEPHISNDGRYLVYRSESTNLGEHDESPFAHIVAAAVTRIGVTGIVPDNLAVADTTSISITGAGFLSGAIPYIEGTQISNIVIVDENTITADVTVAAGTPVGMQDVSVILLGTGPGPMAGSVGTCTDCVAFIEVNCGCGCP
jgi:Tol biopolymer transport system component